MSPTLVAWFVCIASCVVICAVKRLSVFKGALIGLLSVPWPIGTVLLLFVRDSVSQTLLLNLFIGLFLALVRPPLGILYLIGSLYWYFASKKQRNWSYYSSRYSEEYVNPESTTRTEFAFDYPKMESDSSFRILSCPGCDSNIRMPNPPPLVSGKCTKCSCQFRVKKDKHGNFLIYAEDKSQQESRNEVLTKKKCYEILELLEHASQADIQAAFRKKMLEYHPDKVASLGIELKKLSEAKTKQINAAYDFLKRRASNH